MDVRKIIFSIHGYLCYFARDEPRYFLFSVRESLLRRKGVAITRLNRAHKASISPGKWLLAMHATLRSITFLAITTKILPFVWCVRSDGSFRFALGIFFFFSLGLSLKMHRAFSIGDTDIHMSTETKRWQPLKILPASSKIISRLSSSKNLISISQISVLPRYRKPRRLKFVRAVRNWCTVMMKLIGPSRRVGGSNGLLQ